MNSKTTTYLTRALLLLALVVTTATVTQARTEPGWYVSGGLGYVLENTMSFYDEFPAGREIENADSNRTLDEGYNLNLQVGYDMVGFRIEAEILYFTQDVSEFVVPNGMVDPTFGAVLPPEYHPATLFGDLEGDISKLGFFINGYYDIDTGTKFKPYLGIGAGVIAVTGDYQVANVSIDYHDDTPDFILDPPFVSPDPGTVDETNWVLGGQFLAGVWYEVNDQWALGLGYRFTIIDGETSDFVQKLADVHIDTISETYKDSHFELKAKFNF